MTRSLAWVLATTLALPCAAAVARAQTPLVSPCSIIWYDPFGRTLTDEAPRMVALGYNITLTSSLAYLTPLVLSHNSVLVIAFTGTNVLAAQKTAIQDFVQAGGGLLIHQTEGFGPILFAPTGLEVNVVSGAWCGYGTGGQPNAEIVNPAHPLMAGLTNADLSAAADHVGEISPNWTVLVRVITCSDPLLAVGALGLGRVVYEDGNMSPGSALPGSDTYWIRIFNWLCGYAAVSTRKSTWGEVKAIYR